MEEQCHCTFANSVLARFRMGMSASASYQTARWARDGRLYPRN